MGSEAERAFAAFYDASWHRTVACAYAMTGSLGDAEDVAQDAYARAWARWRWLADYDEPAAWVRQVATRLAISRWRRTRTAVRHLMRSRAPEPTPGPEPTSLALAVALRELDERQRRAIVLHHLAGLDVAQVAEAEGCPVGTVKARLSRGRARLAVLLADEADPGHAGVPPGRRHTGSPDPRLGVRSDAPVTLSREELHHG